MCKKYEIRLNNEPSAEEFTAVKNQNKLMGDINMKWFSIPK
jgi:hypothetical protein